MATSTTCPSCGHQLSLPGSMVGPVTCTACGTAFEVPAAAGPARSGLGKSASSTSAVPAAAAPIGATPVRQAPIVRTVPRPPGSPPELLGRLPKPFITSPPMILVGSVFVMLYGMVLFGAVTTWKNIPEPEPPPRPQVQVAFAPIGPAPLPEVSKPSTDKDKDKSSHDSKKADEPKKDSKKTKDGDKPKKKDKKPSNNKGKNEKPKSGDVARKEQPKPDAELALNVPPQPALPAAPPKPEAWGLLSGFPGDCAIQPDADGLTISIPGTLHVFSPDLKVKNAPYMLTDAGGDFTAQVQIVGKIQPGIVPLEVPISSGPPSKDKKPDKKDKKKVVQFPFTFQGAGLLLWKDPNNYIRLERTSTMNLATSKRIPSLLFEFCRDGKIVSEAQRDFRETDTPITLRIIRKGSELRCGYSPDLGKTWLPVKRLEQVVLPPQLQVGISAANVSPKVFAARFQNFELSATTPH